MTWLLIDSWLLLTGSFLLGSAAAYLLAVMTVPVETEVAVVPPPQPERQPVTGRPGPAPVRTPAGEAPAGRPEVVS